MTTLSPLQLARQAYVKAVDALEHKRDVTREISAAEALRQYRELTFAYQQQKEDLELGAFLKRAGVDQFIAENATGNKALPPVATTLDEATNRFLDAITKPYRDRNAA